VVPIGVAIASAGAGWLLADLGGATLASGLAGGACSVLMFLGGVAVLRGKLLRDTIRFALTSIQGAASRGAAAHPA
jgi:hypothetical protein